MKLTEQEHSGYIKPLIDECIRLGEKLSEQEYVIIGNKLIKIIENEFNPEELLKILVSLSPLCIETAEKLKLTPFIKNAQEFLATKKSS